MGRSKSLKSTFIYHGEPEKSVFSGMSDLEIWRKFKAGDDGAFVFIYRTYVNDLFQLGVQLSRDEALIKDCIQDFFIEIRESIYGLSETDNIRLYLIKSFRRKVVRHIKKKNKFVSQDQINDSFFVELAIDEDIINAQFNKEQLTRLNRALSKLRSKDREIIYYYYYENLSYTEIAEILEYEYISSARRSVYKVLKRLKHLMVISVTALFCQMLIQHSFIRLLSQPSSM